MADLKVYTSKAEYLQSEIDDLKRALAAKQTALDDANEIVRRMTPVVDAARGWAHSMRGDVRPIDVLTEAVDAYEAGKC